MGGGECDSPVRMQADNCRSELYSPNIFYICKCHTYGAKLWEFWVVTLRVRDEKYGTFSGYVAESSRRRRSLESLAFPTRVGAIPRLESATSSSRVGDESDSSGKNCKKEARKHCFRASLVISKTYNVSYNKWYVTVRPAITILTIDISLIRMFNEGPDVSLNGSPTVSPTTVAL